MINIQIDNYQGSDILWLGSNEDAWINLQQLSVTSFTMPATKQWRSQLVYHSTVSVAGHYGISVYLSNFLVFHYEQSNSYDGWMAASDIGGFAFFMVVVHALALFSASIFFDDSSSFLKSDSSTSNQ